MKLAMDELAQTLFEEAGDGLFFFEPRAAGEDEES